MSFWTTIKSLWHKLFRDSPEANHGTEHDGKGHPYNCVLSVNSGAGTAFLISSRIALTSGHVPKETRVWVTDREGYTSYATAIRHPDWDDRDSDVAILRLDKPIIRPRYIALAGRKPDGEIHVVGRTREFKADSDIENGSILLVFAEGEGGWSGAPVFDNGKCVAIWQGSNKDLHRGWCVLISEIADFLHDNGITPGSLATTHTATGG